MGRTEMENCSTQLIDGDGYFNTEGMETFSRDTNLSLCGLNYAIVAIMGPQSSGKSTLMNHLFRTSFKEMDAFSGRSQTTKGIWIAKCVGIDPFTIAMDLEGTDGRERGEDDTTFEKQSALFALAVADIVLINMWCHDIGREQAANKPLLKTVFQVMLRLFSPRKTTLLFVIRDKTKTPLEYLEPILREDIQKIWDAVPKPDVHLKTPISDFFNVEVTSLPSYEEKEDEFKEQVAQLRQRFVHSISPGGLAGDRRGVVPASGFSYSAKQIWKTIKENKDLDLPAHKVMVATVRCDDVANEKFMGLNSDERWLELNGAAQAGLVSDFGKRLSSMLEAYITAYDVETSYFDEGVRNSRRKQLLSKMLDLVYPAYVAMLDHLYFKAFEDFKFKLEELLKKGEGFAASVRTCENSSLADFHKGCSGATVSQGNWNALKFRAKLQSSIESHVSCLRTTKLSEISRLYERRLEDRLTGPLDSLFEIGGNNTWLSIRKLLKHETETAVSEFSNALKGFELDMDATEAMVQKLEQHAKSVVEKKAKEEAGKVLMRMKDRFSTVFNHDDESMPRIWTGKEDIKAVTRNARAAALKQLSVLAVLRLEEKSDRIENILYSSLMEHDQSMQGKQIECKMNPLASTSWEEVSPETTLISPVQCKSIWRQFKVETEYAVTQAIAAQEAYKQSNNWLPPPWAIVAMVILGFNEFMMLLRNPLYLLGLFVVYLVSKALWVQMDITGEFRHGPLTGILSITSRFLPTVMNILRRLAEEAQGPRHNTQRPETHPSSVVSAVEESSMSSTLSSTNDDDDEFSSPKLIHRRNTESSAS